MKSIFLGGTKHIPIVYDADTLTYLREAAGLCDTIFSKKEVLEAPESFADTEFIFSTWGMPSFSEEEIKSCFPRLRAIFYAAGTVQSFARPFLHCGVKVFSAWMANAVPVAEGVEQPVAVASSGAAASPIDMKLLAEVVSASNAEFMEAARNACTPEMKEAAEQYVEELKNLTETLSRVAEQAEHMTRDSKEMDNLNRTLTGINTIYEMQLKSISTQVGTIDQINEQTRKMARQIEELNAIYNRMIQALTVNMKQAPGI